MNLPLIEMMAIFSVLNLIEIFLLIYSRIVDGLLLEQPYKNLVIGRT